MSDYPGLVQELHDAIQGLLGVKDVELGIRSLEGIGERELSFPGEFGDLPHLAVRRAKGGLENELLVTAEIHFYQNFEGWIGLEFLAWWVRDLSRSGENVQMRPLALPPVAYGTQLGRTLKFVIEFFFVNPSEDNSPVLKRIGELAASLRGSVADYAEVLAHPTQADHKDIESLKRSAENDDALAQLLLARCLEDGTRMEKDEAESLRWYERAAKHGHPEAKMCLGLCYAHGRGVQPNPGKAIACYREAAEAGLPLAMGLLGQCYAEGRAVDKDPSKAVQWYQRGAESGDPGCQGELGECYEYGRGVPRDLQEALYWYRMALVHGLEAIRPAMERVEAAME